MIFVSDEMNVQAGQIRRLVDDLVSLVGGNDRGIKLIGKESAYRIFRGFGQKYPIYYTAQWKHSCDFTH